MNAQKTRLWQELDQMIEEWDSRVELARYFNYINTIIDIADIELLFAIWTWSLNLGRTGAIFRAQIEKSLSSIARKNGLPEPNSFKELVYFYDESSFTCEAEDINECLIIYTLEDDLKHVKQSIRKGADDWPYGLEVAASVGSFELVKFYLQKMEEDSSWPERKIEEYRERKEWERPRIPMLSASDYFDSMPMLIKMKWSNAENKAIQAAEKAGYLDLADYIKEYAKQKQPAYMKFLGY